MRAIAPLLLSVMLLAPACETEPSDPPATAEGNTSAFSAEPTSSAVPATPSMAAAAEVAGPEAAELTPETEVAEHDSVAAAQPPPSGEQPQADAARGGQDQKLQEQKPESPEVAAPKPEAPAPKAVPWKLGARVEDPAFSVWLEGPAEVVVNHSSNARARVVAKEPYKCNDKYPTKFSWDSQDGLSVAATKVRGMSVAGKKGTLALPFSAVRPGPVTLSGTLSFSVCTKENCRVEKHKLQLSTKAIPQG